MITGATGTNGREIVKQLSLAGVQVRALARNPEKLEPIKGPNVEIVQGDLAKPETLNQMLQAGQPEWVADVLGRVCKRLRPSV